MLQLIAEGKSTKEIARTMGLSPKTIDMYRLQLMESPHIHDVAGLVKYAIKMGVISFH